MEHDIGRKDAGTVDVDSEQGTHHVVADRLARKLSARQVQMIAIGGTIGTGLFLGTGKSLHTGGPASMLIAYSIVGVIVFFTMLALGEMAAFMPIAGVSPRRQNPISSAVNQPSEVFLYFCREIRGRCVWLCIDMELLVQRCRIRGI